MYELSSLTEYDTVRVRVIRRACSDLTAGAAADMLDVTPRQVFRLKARYRADGPAGLVHGNRGRQPANARPAALRQQVLELFRSRFAQYNTPLFAEALADEHGITVNEETLRRWLRSAGIPPKHRHRNRSNHRRCRARQTRFGAWLFLDGSPHRWLGPDRPMLTLILCTDDATGRPLYGGFFPQETLNGCFEVIYHVFQRYGLPGAFYLDRASQFTTTRHGGTTRTQDDGQPTAFESAMHRLAIQLIFADSPQARGRGERINGTFQDRLVAELDHHGITTAEAATAYLNEQFIPKYVKRFGVTPSDARPAFRPVPANLDLRTVLCSRTIREVANDNTISYKGRRYQLLPRSRTVCVAGTTVLLQEWSDGSVHVRHDRAGWIDVLPLQPPPRPQHRSFPTAHDILAVD